MRKITPFLLYITTFCLLSFNSPNGDVVLLSANIPRATADQIEKWETTHGWLLGIRAHDPVAGTPASKSEGRWTMLTTDKRNFAGIFNRYGTEEEDNGAYDWNLLIEPFNKFDYVYDKALENPNKNQGEWFGCINYDKQMTGCNASDYTTQKCMWAEISPYSSFLNNNKWFKGTKECHCHEGAFLQRGDTVAVYGFPVTDDGHGDNPEIHPAQQIWFRYKAETNAKKSTYFLMFLQDASDRFGDWDGSPVYGEFLISFRVKPPGIIRAAGAPLTMNISIAHQNDLLTKNYSQFSEDDDDGYSHALVVDGKKLLIVNEEQSDAGNKALGIKFSEITKLQDGTIQGYVKISMVLGSYDTDEIGVCVLQLEVVKARSNVFERPNNR